MTDGDVLTQKRKRASTSTLKATCPSPPRKQNPLFRTPATAPVHFLRQHDADADDVVSRQPKQRRHATAASERIERRQAGAGVVASVHAREAIVRL